MKKLPKVNTSKLLKAALPYILVGLMATKLGQAYRMASGGDVLDRIFGAFLKIGEAFANPLPSLHPFDLLVGDACGALLWFIVYQKSKNARKYRRGAEYGTARWGNANLDDRLYRMYDKIEDEESQMIEARAKRQAIEAEKLTGDNIYKVLMYFDKLYSAMNDVERRRVMETLISEIQIYEDRQPNGQWLKSIKFKLPIIEEDMEISLDNDTHVER